MALPHHSHYHRETQKIMLRVQQISRQPIPPVRTDRGRASVPAGAICIPVNTQEKKQLARADSAEARPGQARRALRPGLAQRRAGQAREAQPRGSTPESGGREEREPSAPGARAGAGVGDGAVRVLRSVRLDPAQRAQGSAGTKRLQRKDILMQARQQTDTTEPQKSSRSQTRAAVRRRTCKTKKAHKRQQEKRRAYTFFPQAVLKEANHSKGFFSPLRC